MTPFRIVSGTAVALPMSNIDTDVIAPIQALAAGPDADLSKFALRPLRFHEDGSERANFPLNRPDRRGAPILIAGRNFGCGSSREFAVNALMSLGLKCVIAESFGDIFHANCFQNGFLPITLPPAAVDRLMAIADTSSEAFTVDLERQLVKAPGAGFFAFVIDRTRRESLLAGLDDIGLTLRDDAEIRAWQAHDRQKRPWVWENLDHAA